MEFRKDRSKLLLNRAVKLSRNCQHNRFPAKFSYIYFFSITTTFTLITEVFVLALIL